MKILTLTPLAIALFFLGNASSFGLEYESPRTLGLGGAGRAAPLLNDAIYLNPSHGSFTPVYSLFGGYTGYNSGRNYNFSIQDSRTEVFQAGAGFTKRDQNIAINVGASKMIVQRLGIGIGTKILLDNNTNHTTTDLLVSSSFIALPWMYTSMIVDNLIENSSSVNRNLYRTGFLAFKFMPANKVEIFVDPFYSPSYGNGNKAGYSAGLELGVLEDFYLRMGKFQDAEIPHMNTRGSGFGTGLGWIGPKVNFEYAMSRALTSHSSAATNTAHSGSMTVFF